MNVHNVTNYHVINMVTGRRETFPTFIALTRSETLNDCDNVIAIKDAQGQLVEVDFTLGQRQCYLTGNIISGMSESGLTFNRLV